MSLLASYLWENRETYAELAEKIGVHPESMRLWVHGTRRVPADKVPALSEATGIAPYFLRPDVFEVPEGAAPPVADAPPKGKKIRNTLVRRLGAAAKPPATPASLRNALVSRLKAKDGPPEPKARIKAAALAVKPEPVKPAKVAAKARTKPVAEAAE